MQDTLQFLIYTKNNFHQNPCSYVSIALPFETKSLQDAQVKKKQWRPFSTRLQPYIRISDTKCGILHLIYNNKDGIALLLNSNTFLFICNRS